jgi:hypothetical protein
MKSLVTAIAAGTVIAGTSATAATLYYESFDYNTGDLSTETAGVWSDSGSTIVSPGLTYGDLSTAGNKVTMSDDTSWTDVSTELAGALDDGDTLWFSVLINTRNGTNPDFGFALASAQGSDSNNVPISGGGEGLGFRVKNGIKATAWSGTPSSASGAGYTAGETVLVVGEMIFGATDTINIYLPDTDLNLGAVVSTQTASVNQAAFDTLTFMDKAASPRDQIDEIRFGETSADVLVPEPGSLALLGLGGLLIARRRRG